MSRKASVGKKNTQFGQYVRRRRIELGLTQGDIAARMSVDETYVNQFENGRKPSTVLSFLERYADALEVSTPTLIKEANLLTGNRYDVTSSDLRESQAHLIAVTKHLSDEEIHRYARGLKEIAPPPPEPTEGTSQEG